MKKALFAVLAVAVSAAITALLRFLPFWLIGRGKKTPPFLTGLTKLLPAAIMAMLVVYCLKDVQLLAPPYGIPELLGCAIVAALHVWKRNALLSIGTGTVAYMLMVQLIF